MQLAQTGFESSLVPEPDLTASQATFQGPELAHIRPQALKRVRAQVGKMTPNALEIRIKKLSGASDG